MQRNQGCNVIDHVVSRRSFLAGTAGAVGMSAFTTPGIAEQLEKKQRRMLQIFLQGGVSQFESWDPKPNTKYGGPTRKISTSVPGMHIAELLPHTAQRMHRLSIVRSINTRINDHAGSRKVMETGRRVGDFPFIGAVASKYLTPQDAALPGYIHISTRGLSKQSSAFLGAKHNELRLEGVKAPANIDRPAGLTAENAERRNMLRLSLNSRFALRGQQALTEAYNSSYEQAEKLMARKKLFEGKMSDKDLERYGKHHFGTNCIFARDLLENGATCVKVTHHGYDTHAENFNFHLEQLEEFDHTFCMLLDDLHDRGMLDSTLVMVMSEFGRTPKINVRYGRDHWGKSFGMAIGGCGIQPGAVIGATNKLGTEVSDREVDGGHLFHTYFHALGLDSTQDHDIDGRTIPIGDPAMAPIKELLA